MDEREKILWRLVRAAQDVDADARAAFLDARCGDDATLRRDADAALASIERRESEEVASKRVAAESSDIDAAGASRDTDALLDSSLGPFRLVERIGRGGMGVVYRGTREGADFAQDVAIKLVRRGFDFDDVNARFLRERRILARLDHPNLARFIDGGVAPDGRPWFALEYVRGTSLVRWCDERRLALRERVRLFLEVCAAVQHAHAQLIVHRDLKPANILVDGDSHVRLLDFGIARLLEGEDEAGTTIAGRYAFTPEYAAPEQFGGESAGVATDVYALGVILYELLSGTLPYVLDRHDLVAAERVVRNAPPLPLTGAIAREGDAQARLAARATTLRHYRAQTGGDLSRIVDKALAKEPARRYASVETFADDLRRWLAGATVRVSGNGLGYRLRKFVARNRVAVALGSVALLSLLGGTGAALRQAHRAETAAAMARTQAVRAIAARDFLASLLGQASPESGAGAHTTVREVLDRARARIRDELAGDAELRNEMSTLVGKAYNDLGEFEQGMTLLRETARQADADASLPAETRATAHVEFARALLSRSENSEAASEAAAAIALLHDQPSDTLALALNTLATAHYLQSRFDEALTAQREAIATTGRVHGPATEEYASAQLELSYFLAASPTPAEAVPVAEEALHLLERLYPDSDVPVVTRALWALGNALSTIDRDADAAPHLRRARDMVGRIYGRDGTKYMRSLQLLGVAELFGGDVAAARADLDEALRLAQAASPDHPLVPLLLSYRSTALLRGGDAAAALPAADQALLAAQRAQRSDVRDSALIVRVRALIELGRTDEALAQIEALLPEYRQRKTRGLAAMLTAKASAQRRSGALPEARQTLEEAVAASEALGVSGRVDLSLERARMALAGNDPAEARRHAEEAKTLLVGVHAERAPEYAEATRLLQQD